MVKYWLNQAICLLGGAISGQKLKVEVSTFIYGYLALNPTPGDVCVMTNIFMYLCHRSMAWIFLHANQCDPRETMLIISIFLSL